MAGPNLEVFKFGLYIMFPIAWMYYFGTNLENRFSVPDFWPRPEATYKIPFEKSEIRTEITRLRERRLQRRRARLSADADGDGGGEEDAADDVRNDTVFGKEVGGGDRRVDSAGVDGTSNGASWWSWVSGSQSSNGSKS